MIVLRASLEVLHHLFEYQKSQSTWKVYTSLVLILYNICLYMSSLVEASMFQ